ncbi:MAG: tRNA (5-methylaminomethyl-2-thiouridine)(34)-methyltransferase MnmD [Trueperaceae bacterium]|nr:tRNA (5-methylaminomethyl-2-thiouridine)(34)-methyltransferase MnmD [Trueperaceae bacterium]
MSESESPPEQSFSERPSPEQPYVVVTADDSPTLYSPRYQQTFHSHLGALSESRHVFVEATGLVPRLARGETVSVLEVGFGTGLNALLTADACLEQGGRVEYWGLEHTLLSADTLASLGYRDYLARPELYDRLLAWRGTLPTPLPSVLNVDLAPSVSFRLLIGDATEATLLDHHFRAVYHDAFSPDANPELWSEAFLNTLYAALADDGLIASYSVKGTVRRQMQALGFAVRKRPGPPGGKREMLLAAKNAEMLVHPDVPVAVKK